jgi:AbrB family looped-hinge helix DNA binding protein
MMRVTRKGRVTIPLEIRKMLNIAPGSEVDFVVGEEGRVYIMKKGSQTSDIRFSGLRGVATVKMTTKEIMALTRGVDI